MYSKFKLWSVGQGLFYTGKINDEFNFVYDCGGENPYIKEALDKYLKEYDIKKLDMLIISHFDDDHINGLPILLSKIKKISQIYIPYYGGISTYLLLVIYLYIYDFDLLKMESEIIFVDSNLETRDELSEENRENYNLDEKLKIGGIKLTKTKSAIVKCKNIWKFKFYNTYLKKEASSISIEKEIENIIAKHSCRDLSDLLSQINNSDIKNELKAVYNKFCKSSYTSKQNESSLCVFHSPISHSFLFQDVVVCYDSNKYCEYLKYCKYCRYENDYHLEYASGTMLVGDISLKARFRFKHFLTYYEKEMKDINFFLTPHHGAISNWNSDIINNCPNAKFFLNSAGLNNRYGHPKSKVILDIIKDNRILCCSNEAQFVEYLFFMDDSVLCICDKNRKEKEN